jgi:hypothetical protein
MSEVTPRARIGDAKKNVRILLLTTTIEHTFARRASLPYPAPPGQTFAGKSLV